MDTIYRGRAGDDDNLEINKQDYERAPSNYGEDYKSWDIPLSNSNQDLVDPHTGSMISRVTFQPNSSPEATTADLAELNSRELPRRNSPQNNEATLINRAVESATVSRRFFITENGYMGLGPEHMKKGDFIFVLFGGPVPFLLRDAGNHYVPKEGPKPCHTLIGDCFVQGIMDGEVTTEKVNGVEMNANPEKVYLI